MHILIKYCCVVPHKQTCGQEQSCCWNDYDLHITRCRCNSKYFRKKYNELVDIYSLATIVPMISHISLIKPFPKSRVLALICNPSNWEVKTGELEIQSRPQLHSKLEIILLHETPPQKQNHRLMYHK